MNGIDSAGVVAGIILSIFGGVLTLVSFLFPPLLIYALPMLIIGIVILVTLREQEYIEPIRESTKNKKAKRGGRA